MLLPHPLSEFGVPQLVRYQAGQRFDEHHDWYDSPQPLPSDSEKLFNRVASFFVFLEDNCTKGETHFPYINTVEDKFLPSWKEPVKTAREYRSHKKGGVAFRPIAGNAIFWVNLFANGTGDERTIHAGLPVGEGQKTAMNIWPRKIY
jgi:prolyl 4-hydroxylase